VLIFDFLNIDGSAGVPDSKLHLLNKSHDIDWKYLPDELGGGIEAFFEAFHQIHCVVNILKYPFVYYIFAITD
jgi:hypothetical protein